MSDERRIDGDICGGAAAYLLGALTDAEHELFVGHLATCVACREETASLRPVVAALPAAAPQVAAPADLKRRVIATVTREAREQQAASGARAERRARRTIPRPTAWRGAFVGVAGAAVIAIAVVLAFSGGGGGGGGTRVFRAQVTAANASASVRVNAGHAELTIAGMPQSPPDHVYELWIKRSGQPQPTDALFTVSSNGAATVGVPGSIKGVREILVTAEPLGGSRVPTSTPVIVAPLSS
jgi:anti-sigma-K factor RskA